jgi:hypothetical protein
VSRNVGDLSSLGAHDAQGSNGNRWSRRGDVSHPPRQRAAGCGCAGGVIWEYAYEYPPESRTLGGPTKNIALYGDKVFLATYDAALVAIDARSGRQAWRTVKADWTKGYTHTAGPFVADGVVISGINGCERFQEGRLLRDWPRSKPGASSAHLHDRAARRCQRRQLGQDRTTFAPGRHLDDRQLTRAQALYVGTSQANRGWRRAYVGAR